jgi:hypothetical protein
MYSYPLYEQLKAALPEFEVASSLPLMSCRGDHFVADHPEDAFQSAREALPGGRFHLILVGFPGAFQISYAHIPSGPDWLSREQRPSLHKD